MDWKYCSLNADGTMTMEGVVKQSRKMDFIGVLPNTVIQRIKNACEQAASKETAYDPERWEKRKDTCPLAEHCFATAFVVKMLLGGTIMCGTVNGQRHAWNKLTNGELIDLTGEQYEGGTEHVLQKGKEWPLPANVNKRFALFYERVTDILYPTHH